MPIRLILVIATSLLAACDGKDSDAKSQTDTATDNGTSTATAVTVGDDVEFSGYVQKAFTIKVAGTEFSDSENFYSRFIDEKIKSDPKYEVLKDAEITLEGQYGLEEFGKNAKVYMSSTLSDGHLFEGRTDAQSKFVIKVTASALDETFKARVIIRIGLDIKRPDAEAEKYCYILHGNRDGILISESTKPIIFDDFAMQLNTYRCEDVQEDDLVIPVAGSDGDSGTDGDAALPDDTTVVENPDGSKSVAPRAKVAATIRIKSALGAQEDGDNELRSAWMTGDGKIYLSKAPVKSLDDGKYYYPGQILSGLEDTKVESFRLNEHSSSLASAGVVALVPFGSKIIATANATTTGWQGSSTNYACYSGCTLVLDDTRASASDPMHVVTEQAITTSSFSPNASLIPRGDDELYYFGNRKICRMDFSAESLYTCTAAASSNDCAATQVSTVWLNGAYLALSNTTDAKCGYKLIVYNAAGVQQKAYVISKLEVPAEDYANARIVTDGSKLYLVTLKNDELLFRQLDLVE